MGNGATATIPSGTEDSLTRAVGVDELAQGLMLVRASTIKIVRLQLAMERRDRQVALQTVDDLMVLDGKIRDFLHEMPSIALGVTAMLQDIEEERISLAREKFTLGAGIGKPDIAGGIRGWVAPAPAKNEFAWNDVSEAPQIEAIADESREMDEPTSDQQISWMFRVGILMLLAVLGCAIFILAAGAGENFTARILRP